jgi:membrane fusion protein (multidrug efflux system)
MTVCWKGASWRSTSLRARNLFRPSTANAMRPSTPDAGGYLAQFLAAGKSGRQGAVEVEEGRPWPTKQPRNGFLHRRPIIFAIGAVLLASVLGGGYLYVDHARRFQATDDAFIAARQSALAPKVSGYITAVPATDNERVAAGDVIARIDDRDYHIALDQAEAQVAAAQASIENIDAQLGVQQAQVSANQAQVDQAQAALVFAQQQAERYQHLE